MDLDFDCAAVVKDKLYSRFEKGPGVKLADAIKRGMRAAIQEIRHSEPDGEPPDLLWNPLKGVIEEEREALQAIYEYLEAKGLRWTLGCLAEESVQAVGESQFDLVTLANTAVEEEEDIPAESVTEGDVATGDGLEEKEEIIDPVPESAETTPPQEQEPDVPDDTEAPPPEETEAPPPKEAEAEPPHDADPAPTDDAEAVTEPAKGEEEEKTEPPDSAPE
jgi:outer membrane biosynthesis protein TonB